MKLPLTVACWDYDRTRALFDGRVAIEGCDATYFSLPVEETFFRSLRSVEFDVAELSLSSYTILRSRGESPYVAIPVYLSRMFRHSCIYIRKDRGIETPADLKGKTLGVPEFQLTAPVWARGILEDEYGVKSSDIRWRTGGVEQPGRHEKVSYTNDSGIEIEPIPADQTLNQWLLEGRIDGIVAPRAPSVFSDEHPEIGRLFPRFRDVEKTYYTNTGIFPIMHVVGVRRELVERHPWIAASVLKAFTEAKNLALANLGELAALKATLPWLVAEYDETVALMGRDFWRYGVAGNEATLNAFLKYHHEQGLSNRLMTIPELFAPSTLEQVVI
ncbi:ABC transporter substrate-binding protein [Paraburkholderia sp. ZP32-5]|uniref:ABC transporter substrate-binding protein n=1 Tax=Paraburkholderia sp. ZP32-5 TaxID=2883245 RepID=UPI001F2CBDB2|nr:ABC transporter substrate-binding protein [Paraburkholderia sp. ZP32-5]